MAKKLPELQVIMPYKDLQQLLYAAGEVERLRDEQSRLQTQLSALRLQFTELLEELRHIQD